MSEVIQESTEQKPLLKKGVLYIGSEGLDHDVEQIKILLQKQDGKGVLLSVCPGNGQDRFFYRPDNKTEDVSKTVRKFLAITSVFGGQGAVQLIENEKDIPEQSSNLDDFFEVLSGKFKMFERK